MWTESGQQGPRQDFLRSKASALMAQRLVLCGAVCVMLLALCATAEAQQAQKVPRIGFLLASASSSNSDRIAAFKQGLRELGYAEGKNIIVDYRYADRKLD